MGSHSGCCTLSHSSEGMSSVIALGLRQYLRLHRVQRQHNLLWSEVTNVPSVPVWPAGPYILHKLRYRICDAKCVQCILYRPDRVEIGLFSLRHWPVSQMPKVCLQREDQIPAMQPGYRGEAAGTALRSEERRVGK